MASNCARWASLFAAAVITSVACGGQTAGLAGDAGHDATLADSAGCITPDPAAGSPCSGGQAVCVDPNVDACCRGYVWSCVSGAWQKMGLGCPCMVDAAAPPDAATSCGPLTCSGAQYCQQTSGGPPPQGDAAPFASYACQPLPPACGGVASCKCLSGAPPGCTCSESAGVVTVRCFAP